MIGIGFGTWAWGNQLLWGYQSDRDDSILRETFHEAVKGGLSLVDTADSYGTGRLNGRSEYLLGEFIQNLSPPSRHKLTIATKLAPYPWRLGRNGLNQAFFKSKKRLKGQLDRVQLHWSTSRYAPFQEEELIEGLGDLVENGVVKEIGISNMGPERLQYIHQKLSQRGIAIKSLQIQMSLMSPKQENEDSIRHLCEALNIELLAYSPLAIGILAMSPEESKIPATFLRRQLFNKLIPGSMKLREGLNKMAKDRCVSQVEIALNWCRAHGAMPIPGLRTKRQANEAIAALKWTLSSEEKKFLDKLRKENSARMPSNPFQSN